METTNKARICGECGYSFEGHAGKSRNHEFRIEGEIAEPTRNAMARDMAVLMLKGALACGPSSRVSNAIKDAIGVLEVIS